jgi:hypothetical protein
MDGTGEVLSAAHIVVQDSDFHHNGGLGIVIGSGTAQAHPEHIL